MKKLATLLFVLFLIITIISSGFPDGTFSKIKSVCEGINDVVR